MKYFKPVFLFVVAWVVLLFIAPFGDLPLLNGVAQMALFSLVVCWPIWKTGRLSYVDIGWPWGLVVIGVLTLFFGQGYHLRVWLVGGIYIFIGARMGLGALQLWRKGYMQKEFPRYQYQHRRWERAGKTNTMLAMQVDALA